MFLSLKRGGGTEAKALEQTNGPEIRSLDGGKKLANAVSSRKVRKHRICCDVSIAATPVLAREGIGDPSPGARDDRGLHVPDWRMARRKDYPVQPDLLTIRRLASFQPFVNVVKVFDRRRWRIVEVTIDLRISEDLKHRSRVGHGQRLKHELGRGDGLHAL